MEQFYWLESKGPYYSRPVRYRAKPWLLRVAQSAALPDAKRPLGIEDGGARKETTLLMSIDYVRAKFPAPQASQGRQRAPV
jgi:hypothetical protein